MIRRARANVVLVLLGSALVLGTLSWPNHHLSMLTSPALASAQRIPDLTGGAPITVTQSVTSAGRAGTILPGVVGRGDATVSATGNGITLATRANAMLGWQLRFTGRVPLSGAGHEVVIERSDPVGGWLPTASALADSGGAFTATWNTDRTGHFAIRASSVRAGSASPSVSISVYKSAIATLYGQGFFGSTTACGQVLTPQMLGVAHRWLKCGTLVSIYWNRHTIVVPVIDRGPYANNADWDLTEATGRLIGMYGTETIGAVALRR